MTRVSMADVFRHFSNDIRLLNPNLFSQLGIKTHAVVDSDRTTPLHELNEKLSQAETRPRSNKYGAKKTKIGDLTFDSKKEASRYLDLKGQEDRGEITDLILQCRIILLEGFTYQGQKVRAINYTADFVYQKDSFTIIEDVKSEATARTEAFRIRWRLLLWLYKDVPDVRCILTGA